MTELRNVLLQKSCIHSEGQARKMPRLDSVITSMDDIKKSGGVSPTSLLQQKANEIRSNRVNWQSYQQGQMITREDFDFIASYDSLRTPELRESLIQKSKHQCAKTLINLLGSIAKEQTVQYILVMINDMLEEDHTRVEIFKDYAKKYCDSVWGPFFNVLNRADNYIKHQTAYIITKMMCWGEHPMEERDMQYFFGFLKQQMKATGNEYLQAVGNCLQMLLRLDYYRVAFISNDMLTPLLTALSSKIGFQNQYQFVFCLWCITFNKQLAAQVAQFNVVPVLADILNESAKEKVMRIILATFRNLLEKPGQRELVQDMALSMVQCKVLKQLLLLESRKYDDQDIEDDISFLIEKLQTSVLDLSSFDEYVTEVRSGRLEWSPVHKSEKFWRENAIRLNERNYELLKMLIRLLENRDPLIISVAAHDVGEYVRHFPRGKSVIEQLGGKQLVMQHLAHEDPNVRYEALLAVQKLMVHNWEYLGKQLEKDKDAK